MVAYLVANSILICVLYYKSLRYIQNEAKDNECEKYGYFLTTTNIVGTIAKNIDKILIGVLLGAPELAIYSIAIIIPSRITDLLKLSWAPFTPKISAQETRMWEVVTKAKRFVWCLRLGSKNEWFEYMRDENAIHPKYGLTIPKRPNLEYKNDGWIDWDEWLGFHIEFIPYDDILRHIHKLNLRSISEWRDYCSGNHYKHQKRTEKMPCFPDIAYNNRGWKSWEDWLGKIQLSDLKSESDLPEGTVECRCRGMVENCLECDGKGYIVIKDI